jgi:hypothetical protein
MASAILFPGRTMMVIIVTAPAMMNSSTLYCGIAEHLILVLLHDDVVAMRAIVELIVETRTDTIFVMFVEGAHREVILGECAQRVSREVEYLTGTSSTTTMKTRRSLVLLSYRGTAHKTLSIRIMISFEEEARKEAFERRTMEPKQTW